MHSHICLVLLSYVSCFVYIIFASANKDVIWQNQHKYHVALNYTLMEKR